ncbi:MAG TPA: hypothetical protein VKB71_01550 [Rhizomicrobium sp.]|nr:hypothetical protein [Rhizomicrobium sp.]
MSKSDKEARLEKLRAEHAVASDRAALMLRKYGEDSPQFAEADRIAAEISMRIDKIVGGA